MKKLLLLGVLAMSINVFAQSNKLILINSEVESGQTIGSILLPIKGVPYSVILKIIETSDFNLFDVGQKYQLMLNPQDSSLVSYTHSFSKENIIKVTLNPDLVIEKVLEMEGSNGQFTNEDLDKIINERTWCITSLTINGENDRPDGKWFYISGMKLVYGDNDYISGVEDILNKKYTEDGITITSLFYGREQTFNFKIPKENHSLMADGVIEITNLKDTYVELISEINEGKDYYVARLTCTSLIGRWGSLPISNWNGKNEQEAEQYFNRGIDKAESNDHLEAIAYFTKSIVLNPNKETIAYNYRGGSKEQIGDLTGACADWKKAMEFGDREAAYYVADKCN